MELIHAPRVGQLRTSIPCAVWQCYDVVNWMWMWMLLLGSTSRANRHSQWDVLALTWLFLSGIFYSAVAIHCILGLLKMAAVTVVVVGCCSSCRRLWSSFTSSLLAGLPISCTVLYLLLHASIITRGVGVKLCVCACAFCA